MSDYRKETLQLLDDLDEIIKMCHASGDPLRERMAAELSRAQRRIYRSDEWKQTR